MPLRTFAVRATRSSVSRARGPARLDEFDRIQRALPVVTAASIGLIAILLLATFRAVGAPLVTLAAAGIAYLVAVRVVAWAGAQASISVPQEVEPLVIVLLLGVVTDYSIFFLAGARSRLAAGEDRIAATRGATASLVPIVLTAGLIVAAGTASLLAGTLDSSAPSDRGWR